tara:strand:- start:2520 stop:3737 length:1218 start_codon:yes stop_codon:yes gene_type:complete
MGYQGGMDKFQDFLATDPARQQQMDMYTNKAAQMAKGGMVKKMQTGGLLPGMQPSVGPMYAPAGQYSLTGQPAPTGTQAQATTTTTPNVSTTGVTGVAGTPIATQPTPSGQGPGVTDFSVQQMYSPGVPVGGETVARGINQADPTQYIMPGTGTLYGQVATPTAMALTAQAGQPTQTQANTMQAATAAPAVDSAMNATQAAQANPQDPRSQVTAAQQTASSVGNLQAAQGNAILINNPVQRQIQQGELVSGTGVDAAKAAQVTAQTQAAAATANPSAQTMVANQLDGLMQQFQGGNPPAWAAGAMRSATAAMAARGMGASSLAGQAIVQAAMESALPIAMADAQTVAKFESQNLSNRQQSAMLAAEQRARFMGQEFDQTFQMKVITLVRLVTLPTRTLQQSSRYS